MSRKNKRINAVATETVATETVATETVATETVATPYLDLLGETERIQCKELYNVKGHRSRNMSLAVEGQKKGSDTIAVFVVVCEAFYRKLDKGEQPVLLKFDCCHVVNEQTGYFGKFTPDGVLHSSLNRMGGNQFNYSGDKSGTTDLWASTPRADLRPVLMIDIGGMYINKGLIFANPEVWALGGYVRPTKEQLAQACATILRRNNGKG